MTEHLIVRVIVKMLVPFVLLFGIYVQMHGDFGPGGGFQAGVIFAAGFILYAIIFGVATAREVLSATTTRVLLVIGVLLYSGVGVAGILMGGNYLDYNVLAETPTGGQHVGIILVEFGVGITVAASVITIFCTFAGRRPEEHEEEYGEN